MLAIWGNRKAVVATVSVAVLLVAVAVAVAFFVVRPADVYSQASGVYASYFDDSARACVHNVTTGTEGCTAGNPMPGPIADFDADGEEEAVHWAGLGFGSSPPVWRVTLMDVNNLPAQSYDTLLTATYEPASHASPFIWGGAGDFDADGAWDVTYVTTTGAIAYASRLNPGTLFSTSQLVNLIGRTHDDIDADGDADVAFNYGATGNEIGYIDASGNERLFGFGPFPFQGDDVYTSNIFGIGDFDGNSATSEILFSGYVISGGGSSQTRYMVWADQDMNILGRIEVENSFLDSRETWFLERGSLGDCDQDGDLDILIPSTLVYNVPGVIQDLHSEPWRNYCFDADGNVTMLDINLGQAGILGLKDSGTPFFFSQTVLSPPGGGDGATNPPDVETTPATSITDTSAVLNGELNDLGGASSVNVWFEWDDNFNLTSPTTTSAQQVTTTGGFSAPISGLSPGTTYYFRAVAQNSAGTDTGSTLSAITTDGSGGSGGSVCAAAAPVCGGAGGTLTGEYLEGYAWSDTIGWIDFDWWQVSSLLNPEDSRVNLIDCGGYTHLQGYAWSQVGWIKFDPAGPYPVFNGTSSNSSQIGTSNEINGWVRACSAADPEAGDWDGWISLRGATPAQCEAGQVGCSFNSGSGLCESSIGSCSELSVSDCTQRPGCNLEGQCQATGTALCSDLTDDGESICTARGCTWGQSVCVDNGLEQCDGALLETNQTECLAQQGCSWDPEDCSGSHLECGNAAFQGSSSVCTAQNGCNWDPAGPCSGTATQCSGLNATQCGNQLGCSHDATQCRGTPRQCSAYWDDQDECLEHGCNWDASVTNGCNAPLNCSNFFNESDCNTFGGGACFWQGSCRDLCAQAPFPISSSTCRGQHFSCIFTQELPCFGTPPDCETAQFQVSESVCENHQFCQWFGGGTCDNSPGATSCGGLNESQCGATTGAGQLGCSWDQADCSGSAFECSHSSFQSNPSQCNEQLNCAHDTANCYNDPGATACGALSPVTQSVCEEQNGCSWVEAACGGTPAACSTFTAGAVCDAQLGCGTEQVCVDDPTPEACVTTSEQPWGVDLIGADPQELSGFAWGDEVVGWVSFNCADSGTCTDGVSGPDDGNDDNDHKVTIGSGEFPVVTPGGVTNENYCTTPSNASLTLNFVYASGTSTPIDHYDVQVTSGSLPAASVDSCPSCEVSRIPAGSGTTGEVPLVVALGAGGAGSDRLTYNDTYNWRVRVWDTNNRASGWVTGTAFSTASGPWPAPSFTYDPSDPLTGQSIDFTSTTTCYDAAGQVACGAITYAWDFDDTNTSTSANPTHSYAAANTYNVQLTVTDPGHPVSGSCPADVQSVTVDVSDLQPPEYEEIVPF